MDGTKMLSITDDDKIKWANQTDYMCKKLSDKLSLHRQIKPFFKL